MFSHVCDANTTEYSHKRIVLMSINFSKLGTTSVWADYRIRNVQG